MEKAQYSSGELTGRVHMLSHHITLEWSSEDLFLRSRRQEQLISTNFSDKIVRKDSGNIGCQNGGYLFLYY